MLLPPTSGCNIFPEVIVLADRSKLKWDAFKGLLVAVKFERVFCIAKTRIKRLHLIDREKVAGKGPVRRRGIQPATRRIGGV